MAFTVKWGTDSVHVSGIDEFAGKSILLADNELEVLTLMTFSYLNTLKQFLKPKESHLETSSIRDLEYGTIRSPETWSDYRFKIWSCFWLLWQLKFARICI